MTAHKSPDDLLTLHAVRLRGFADTEAVAARFGLGVEQTSEQLLDAQARGWVARSTFADVSGWSLTEAGRRHNETQLREELASVRAEPAVAAAHERFLPLNAEATRVFTAWQLAPADGPRPVDGFRQLAAVAEALQPLEASLTEHLSRFAGYHRRYLDALGRAVDDPAFVTGVSVESCHRVWFELHEDLIATLGLAR